MHILIMHQATVVHNERLIQCPQNAQS